MKRFLVGATSTTDVSVASSRNNYTRIINNATLSMVALFVAFVLAGGTAWGQPYPYDPLIRIWNTNKPDSTD
jgi:hypothetical protein